MTLHRLVLIAVSVAALVAVAPEAQGNGKTSITSCGQTVTTNAVLAQDLVCTGQGIVVGASAITIDLKGHTLRGNRSAGHYGINDAGGYKKITLKNGVVRNFDWGVRAIVPADQFSVSKVIATGNLGNGFFLTGDKDSITSSAAFGNSHGIVLGGTGGSIKSSTASGNDVGIVFSGVAGSIKSSTASGNSFDGIQVVASGSISIESSTTSGNGNSGMSISANAASLTGNVSDGNGFAGGLASDLSGLGIWVYFFTTTPVGTNTALGNDDPAECNPASLC